jgi:hypothetical protein
VCHDIQVENGAVPDQTDLNNPSNDRRRHEKPCDSLRQAQIKYVPANLKQGQGLLRTQRPATVAKKVLQGVARQPYNESRSGNISRTYAS